MLNSLHICISLSIDIIRKYSVTTTNYNALKRSTYSWKIETPILEIKNRNTNEYHYVLCDLRGLQVILLIKVPNTLGTLTYKSKSYA